MAIRSLSQRQRASCGQQAREPKQKSGSNEPLQIDSDYADGWAHLYAFHVEQEEKERRSLAGQDDAATGEGRANAAAPQAMRSSQQVLERAAVVMPRHGPLFQPIAKSISVMRTSDVCVEAIKATAAQITLSYPWSLFSLYVPLSMR